MQLVRDAKHTVEDRMDALVGDAHQVVDTVRDPMIDKVVVALASFNEWLPFEMNDVPLVRNVPEVLDRFDSSMRSVSRFLARRRRVVGSDLLADGDAPVSADPYPSALDLGAA
ncbi:MAG: hypothetical protein KDB86_13820 [Actinobacteria bacterium]|nr:hypothetical protein [Actinomycetota bacterium]MCB9390296.1 hypothetical protein [Acidimicrobiia bacterium]